MGTQYLFRQTIQVTSEFIKIIVCGITYAFTWQGKGGGATNCVENKEKERR